MQGKMQYRGCIIVSRHAPDYTRNIVEKRLFYFRETRRALQRF